MGSGLRTDPYLSWRMLFPQRQLRFCRSQWGKCFEYFGDSNHRRLRFFQPPTRVFFPPHLRKAGEECRDIAFGFSAGKLRHWTPCVPCMEREVHCQAHSETKRFPSLGREEVGPYSDGHSPIRRARAGSEEGRRKAQGRGPRAQLERPPFFPLTSFPEGFGCQWCRVAQPQTDNITQ